MKAAASEACDCDLVIAPLRRGDLPSLICMMRQACGHLGSSPADSSTNALLREAWIDPPFATLIATRAGRPVGYAAWWPAYHLDRGERCLCLQDLFVLPEERRRGVARKLIDHLEGIARVHSMACILRVCRSEDRRALHVHAVPGFTERATETFFAIDHTPRPLRGTADG